MSHVEIDLEIPFHDVDQLGVVWHGHYYKYMELARTALLRKLDLEVSQIRALGYRLYVIETKCRYSFPLRYADKARVTARLQDVENRINIAYGIFNITANKRSARGHTILATTDDQGQLLYQTPAPLLHRLLGDHRGDDHDRSL